MDWVYSMTLGRPGGPMRASALQERQLWRGGKAPQALLCAASSPLREEPFLRGRDYCVVVSTTSPIDAVRVTLRGAAAVWV